MPEPHLTTIFAKRPVAGAVKTRLCPPLRPAEAAELALAMLDDTVEKCLACTRFETSIRAADPADLSWFRERFPGIASVEPQEGAELGDRLARHFAQEAQARPGWTFACVGSDAPHVPTERIEEAHRALEEGADLALGPDLGGGYYVVALARPVSELFTRVPMSSHDMCARTIDLARTLGLRVHLLESDYDVDGPEDLERLARRSPESRSARLAASLLSRER